MHGSGVHPLTQMLTSWLVHWPAIPVFSDSPPHNSRAPAQKCSKEKMKEVLRYLTPRRILSRRGRRGLVPTISKLRGGYGVMKQLTQNKEYKENLKNSSDTIF